MSRVTPLTLRVDRFKSYSHAQTFHFPDAPGLYFMQGVNEAEPRLGGNACGKTTLLGDALTWCLHGKTPRGLKAGEVCSWDHEKGTRVEFDFLLDGVRDCIWTLTRTWGPISWTLTHQAEFVTDEAVVDLSKDAANPVLAALRLEFEPFLNSVLTAQSRPMFLDMKKDAQAQLFSDVMGLEAWVERSERASKRASAQDAASRKLEQQLAEVRGRLDALDDADAGVASDRWEKRRTDDLAALADAFERNRGLRKAAQQALTDAERGTAVAREWLRQHQPDERLPALLKAGEEDVRRREDELRDQRNHLRGLDEREEDLLDEQAPCPVCGHHLGEKERRQHLEGVQAEISLCAASIRQREGTLERARADVARVRDDMQAQMTALANAQQAVRNLERDESDARRNLLTIDRDMDRIEDREDELRAEVNPFAAGLDKQRAAARELREREADLVRSLDDSHWRHSIFSYWVKGFKELRLREIAGALAELEVEVNSAVSALGLLDWELEFAVDRETKGGGVQRGFSVLVRSPKSGGRAVPWESWSGGESQRLRIAAQMGLADLIRARTGCDFPLEVWDEPTNGLSPVGLDDLFAALAERARHEQRIVFLVDHKAHSFGGFAGTATAVMTNKGSRVKTSWAKDV